MPRLRIVSVNDVYSLDHLPRLATLLRKHRAEDPADAFIAILAGDFLAPSMLSSLDAGVGMIECLNAIGIDYVILGNHEDDIPTAELAKRVAEFRGTWLDTNAHALGDALPKTATIAVGTVKVGLLGVVMNDPSVYRGVPFGSRGVEPAIEVAVREGEHLYQTCTSVIAITHQSMEDDRALATQSRFAIIIGGHEHVPFVETVNGTFIVKSGMDAERAAIVDLVWPAEASAVVKPIVTVTLEPVSGYEEDAAMRARVERHMAKVHALETATLLAFEPGTTLSSIGTRRQQTTLGTLICSTIRDTLMAEAAIFNGGGIRASRSYQHHFTYGDLKGEVPFDNEIVVVRIPGQVLIEAVAASRAHAPAESGGFLQVDDHMTVDETHRVTHIAGAPVDPSREYAVALVRNFLDGLDHIEPLSKFGREHPERIPESGCGRDAKQILIEAFSLSLYRQLAPFDVIDANHDGRISKNELEAAIAVVTHEVRSPVIASLVMGAVDTNHDELISRDESVAAKHEE